MERRFDNRWPAHLEVRVADLDGHAQCTGRLSDISAAGISAMLPGQIAPGTAIRLEVADSSLFGVVIYSEQRDAMFRTGIELIRVLIGGADLSRLLRAILQETLPATPGLELSADVPQ